MTIRILNDSFWGNSDSIKYNIENTFYQGEEFKKHKLAAIKKQSPEYKVNYIIITMFGAKWVPDYQGDHFVSM